MMRWPNDWQLKHCMLFCAGTTVTEVLLTVLPQTGLEIPVVHQVAGFVFLTFVPGILLLRIFRIHSINVVESMAYSAGLSLVLIMFSGAAINFLLPALGIQHPITPYPILWTITIEIIALMIAACFRDKSYRAEKQQLTQVPDINSILFLLVILLLVIAGVKISDLTGNNWVLIASLLGMAVIVGLAAFKCFIRPGLYPFALFIISLGLLYQTSLMSPYLIGSDIYTEYQFFGDTVTGGLWNYSIPNPVNACLSIVMLGPAYSFMMGISGIWIFKAVYPVLFSFLPLIMFRFLRIQIGALPAFLAVFFFMAVPTFSLEMVSLCRQQIAELFFGLFFLLLVERKIGSLPKLVMMLVFALSIVVSHYSLSFITLIYLALLIPLVLILRSKGFLAAWRWLTRRTGGLPDQYGMPQAGTLPIWLLVIVTVTYYALALTWYLKVASGYNFASLSNLWVSQSSSVSTGISTNKVAQDLLIEAALGIDFLKVTWQGQVFRVLQYITQFFIIVGCLRLLLMPKGLKFRIEFIAVSALSVAMLAACLKLPSFAAAFNTTRWYHVLLITLAPFFIIGGQTTLQILSAAWRKMRKRTADITEGYAMYLQVIATAVMVPYFIVTSGILYEATGMQETAAIEAPFSIALSSHRLDLMGNFSKQDDDGAAWLSSHSRGGVYVYSDIHTWKILVLNRFPGGIATLTPQVKPNDNDLLFVTKWNASHNQLTLSTGYPGLRLHTALSGYVNADGHNAWKERIYNTGATSVFRAYQAKDAAIPAPVN